MLARDRARRADLAAASASSRSASSSSSSSAACCSREPSVLILDEPNSALSRAGDRAALRRAAQDARLRHHDALRLAPARGGLRDRRHGHGHAQRRHVLTRARAGADDRRRSCARCSAVTRSALYPGPQRRATPGRRGDAALDGLESRRAAAASRTSASRRTPARSSGSPGIQGSGVSDLLGALFGDAQGGRAGRSRSRTAAACPRSATAAARRGVSLVPADRRRQGLMLEHTIAQNIGAGARWARCGRGEPGSAAASWRAPRAARSHALQIKAPSPWTHGAPPLGRQPAEGRDRQVARDQPRRDPARRPGARRRRRREAGDLRARPRGSPTRARSSSSTRPRCPS